MADTFRAHRLGGRLLWAVLLMVCLCQLGCNSVQRRMTIRSNPSGARVIVDGEYEIGTTPCSTSFLYYGTREIKLIKDGYETLVVKQPVSSPWYEIPPLDFFSENFYPGELRDNHVFTYNLQPTMQVPTDVLLDRADGLRDGVKTGAPLTPQQMPLSPLPPAMNLGPPYEVQPAYPGPAMTPGVFAPPPVSP
ncbi:MAG: PEGA domain-containing protein [Pirellulales bacterium]